MMKSVEHFSILSNVIYVIVAVTTDISFNLYLFNTTSIATTIELTVQEQSIYNHV